ncbi:tail fiber protein [Myxococcota bacterium]|nr:tail fiber protein [Myxococcota bacterium]
MKKFAIVYAAILMMSSACSNKAASSNGDCQDNADCASGQVCFNDACQNICNSDSQCSDGNICVNSLCSEGERSEPNIIAVDGDANELCPDAPGTKCIQTGLLVSGANLEGSLFTLSSTTDSNRFEVSLFSGSTDTLAHLELPNIAPGNYTLTATNAAGSDQESLTLLQGQQGINGQDGVDGSPDTAAQILGKLITVDGTGSGLDADTLDGSHLADIQAQLDTIAADAAAGAVPCGTVSPFAGPIEAIPTGWLLCDGAEINRADYAQLFTVIGISHGGGDGVTTFELPDYRGRFLRGVDHGAGRDDDASSRDVLNPNDTAADRVGSVQGDQLESHRHSLYIDGNTGTTWGIPQGNTGAISGSHSRSTAYTGGAETRPENAYVNYLVKF